MISENQRWGSFPEGKVVKAKQRAIWVASPTSLLWHGEDGKLGPAPWDSIDRMLSAGVSIVEMCECDTAEASVLIIVEIPVPSEPEAKLFSPTDQPGYGIVR